VLVRRVTPAEHAAVADLTARVYLAEGYADEGYEPSLRAVAAREESAEVLVAVVDGEIAGAVTVATRGGEWAEQAGPGEAVIRMLAVDPRRRGAGVGAALVQACLDRARADGCHVVRLSTQPSMTAAHRVYERLGFVRTPSYDWEPVPGVQLLGYALTL
jgi:ribosomal protein S18 acetylase RimI-like enzyme